MRVIIAGSRKVKDYDFVARQIKDSGFEITTILAGGCKGVDELAVRYAEENNIPYEPFNADWKKYGVHAGPIRNEEMARHADALIAIPYKDSKGTNNMINIAKKKFEKIHVAEYMEEKRK